jgi:hypothetical protein
MGLRVRKLAKELRRSPSELLGHLQTMGYLKYQSPEDMLADSVVSKLRRTLPKGNYRPRAELRTGENAGQTGLMGKLVPGVVRLETGGQGSSASRAKASVPLTARAPASTPKALGLEADKALGLEADKALSLAADRALDLEAERAALVLDLKKLQSEQSSLAAERANLAAERERVAKREGLLKEQERVLEVERSAFADRVAEDTSPNPMLFSLGQAFEERGLIGVDEFERALGGMASARVLREIVPHLYVQDQEEVGRILRQRLRLVGGEPLHFLESFFGMVSVSDDRAEMDGQKRTRSAVEALSESLLLNGVSTVTLVVECPEVFRCVQEYLDERITLRGARKLSISGLSAQIANRGTLVWGLTLNQALQEAAQSSGHRLFWDETTRGVVQHCERTRSWLAE